MLKINQEVIDNFVAKINNKANITHNHNSHIAYGQVDGTSTSTVFTATVDGVTELTDGTTVMLKNGVVTSATGFTINVNNLGAKPVYSNMAAATADTTIFNINYTMIFIYDSTRVAGGCWICYRGYNTNDNTIGYQIRTNNTVFTTTDKGYRYRLWLQTDEGKLMPVNTSTSTNATANRSSYMNTRKFWLDGKILYNSTKADYQANVTLPSNTMWQQYNFTLGYSFNNTSKALELTSGEPLYMVATDEGNGKGKLASPYYTQTLPSTEDNKLYIYLGHMTSAVNMELALDHPIFEYKNNGIRLYRDTYTTSEVDTLLNGKSDTNHTHNYANSSHTHGNLQNDGSVGTSNNASKNVVTDSNGKITTEAKPTIPSASSTTPSADSTNGAIGSGTTWAKADHQHPKSSIYAESTHNHTKSQITDFPTLSSVATSGSYNDLSDKPNIPEGATVDTELDSSSSNAIANSTVTTALSGKANSSHNHTKSQISDFPSTMTPSSHTHGNIQNNGTLKVSNTLQTSKSVCTDANGNIIAEDKNNHTHSQYLTSHQDISGKIDTAGTGLSKSGTTLNHSNSITALTTASLKKIKYDGQGHITETSDVSASDLPSHTHSEYTNPTIVTNTNGWNSTLSDEKIPSEKLVKNTLDTKITKTSTDTGFLKSNGSVDNSSYLTTGAASSTYVAKENGKGLFSGSYSDLTNKPSYTPTITSSDTGAYKMGSINISGSSVDIYAKDTNTEYTHPTYNNVSKNTSALYKIKTNNLGHIIEIANAEASDLPSHTHNQYLTSHQTVDNALSSSSENPVQNKIITNKINKLGDIDSHYQNIGEIFGTDFVYSDDYEDLTLWDKFYYSTETDRLYYLKGYGNDDEIAIKKDIPDISGKENSSNKSSSITTDTGSTTKYPTVKAVEDYAQPKGNYLTSHQDITGKLNIAQTSYKGKNVVVDSTSGNITFEDKNNHTHSNYLTSSDISEKIDTAGTGLSKSGTTLNHSNSITAQNSEVFKKFKYDAQGHITGISNVTDSDLPSHTHDSQYVYMNYEENGQARYGPLIYRIQSIEERITEKEDKTNKVTSLSSSSTNTQYPSALAVYNALSGATGGVSSYRNYTIVPSDYNPQIDDYISVTVTVTDMAGNPVANEETSLYVKFPSISSEVRIYDDTDNNGQISFTNIQMTDWGLIDFRVGSEHCQVNVDGWRVVAGDLNGNYAFLRNKTHARWILRGWSYPYSKSTTWENFGAGDYGASIRPNATLVMISSSANAYFYVDGSGNTKWRAISGSISANAAQYGSCEWAIRDEDL